MNARSEKTMKALIQAMKATHKGTKAYDTTAQVVRVDGDTAWVHIPGGVAETPVKLTINAVKGDLVQVRVSGGKAWIVGNETKPPTDDTKANVATEKATEAGKTADKALNQSTATKQHFWHKEEGTDAGTHLTEIPQAQFEEDPEHGGGNLLAKTDGIHVRDGLTDLAHFGEHTKIGKDDDVNIEIKDGKVLFNTPELQNAIRIGASDSAGITYGTLQLGSLHSQLQGSMQNGTAVIGLSARAPSSDGHSTADLISYKPDGEGGTYMSEVAAANGNVLLSTYHNSEIKNSLLLDEEDIKKIDPLTMYSHPVKGITQGSYDNIVTVPDSSTFTDIGASFTLEHGLYLLIGTVIFPTNSTGRRGIRWYFSGDTLWEEGAVSQAPTPGTYTRMQVSRIVNLESRTTMKLQALQTSGADLTGCVVYARYIRMI